MSSPLPTHRTSDRPVRDGALEARLAAHLDRPVYAFRSVASTMDIGHQLASRGRPEGTLIWTERQTRGRGRRWESPGGGVYLSLILRPRRPAEEIPQLSLVAGLAAAETIHRFTGAATSVRWPNDVLIKGRKVAGILIERASDAVILGAGINVTTAEADLPDTATSMTASGWTDGDPVRLTIELYRSLRSWYDRWSAGGFSPIREALRPWIGGFGHPVRISVDAGGPADEGVATDLDDRGRLLVRLDSGIIRPFGMGEVTLLR